MPVIEVDLKEVLAKMEQRLEQIEQILIELKVGQVRLEEKVDGLSKRLDNQEFTHGALSLLSLLLFWAVLLSCLA